MKILPDRLIHYGIPGQKWGVRHYQNKDGTYTEAGRKRYRETKDRNYALKTHDDVERIFSSFSKKDKRLLDANEDDSEYMSREATAYWIRKRIISKEKDMPVAFLDIVKGKDGEANVALGTDSNYRQKGHASELAKRGSKWIDEHLDEFNKVNWGAFKENEASISLAKKNGFTLDKESDDYVVYSKSRQKAEQKSNK